MLTRAIHDSISVFAIDERITELAQDEIPDAKEHLNLTASHISEISEQTNSAIQNQLMQTTHAAASTNEMTHRSETSSIIY